MTRFIVAGCAFFVLTVGAGCFGSLLSYQVAPRSGAALVIGFFMLPVAFALGVAAWRGTATVWETCAFLWTAVTRRSLGPAVVRLERSTGPAGRATLIPVSVGVCVVCGLTIGLLSERPWVWVALGYGALGLGYGVLLFLLAGKGRLDNMVWEEGV